MAKHASSHARPPSPEPRPRPSDIVRSSLIGDFRSLEAQPEWLDIDEKQRIIRFFVSSTFDDTKHERDVLICCVLPALQQYARSVGFEVVMSEMRFGIRKSSSDNNKTTEICMSELERCLQSSAGISYILLSCNRYGFRMPPRRIPACDMGGLLGCMTAVEQSVVLDYYALDDNVIRTPRECYNIGANIHSGSDVPGPAYIIQNANLVPRFWERFGMLQSALRGAASRYWPDSTAHACDPCSQHPSKFFSFSITEEEISRGLFWRDSDLIRDTALVFQRTLQTCDGFTLQHLNVTSPELKNFIDLSSDKTAVDLDASRCLEEQQRMIVQVLSQNSHCLCKFDALEWHAGKGVNPLHPPHAEYLKVFAELCLARLLHSIDTARGNLAVEKHAEMAEAIFHIKFARECCSKFLHSPTTLPVTDSLSQYLAASCGRAFVVCGASGSGKTYLMAQAAYSEARAIHGVKDAAVICRFLGTSPASSSAYSLLRSICNQLAALSSKHYSRQNDSDCDSWETVSDSDCSVESSSCDASDGSQVEADFDQLQVYFKHALQNWPCGRLVVFLDSLDQLDDSLGGRRLNWLPTHGLAPGVRLVASTLPDDPCPADGKPFTCWSTLQARYSDSSCFIEVQPVDDTPLLCLHLLKFQKQKLNPAQLAVVDAAVKKSPKTQTPLVVRILATRLSEWPSYSTLDPDAIDTSSVRALIIQEFKALETKHGPELVRAALSFITLAKDGVSETELSEMLSLDDNVLASVYEWWVPPVRTLPTSPLTMLLADLNPYLTRGGAASGSGLIKWYHRQFWEAADDYYLSDADERRSRHAQLSEFFLGTWADRSKAYNDRLKSAVQKMVPGEESGDRRVRPQPLCMREGQNIFETKNNVDAVNERRCREAVHHLLAARLCYEAADELCNLEGICARVLCGEGLTLNQQLPMLELQLKQLVCLCDVRALHQLRRVEHYSRWLQRDMTTITSNPQVEIFNTCSRQPEISLARKQLLTYLQLTSSKFSFETISRPQYRSFILGVSPHEFDACVAELQYHKRQVNCIAYSPDSCMLASASMDNTVVIWNITTGMLEGVIKGHTEYVESVAWAPDGRYIVTGSSDRTARVWDTLNLKEIASLSHTEGINAVDWSSRGNYIASGSRAKKAKSSGITIQIWDARKFELIAKLRGHEGDVLSVAFDCTERRLASGSQDMTIRIWDVQSHQQLALLLGHTGIVAAIAFDCTGKYLASCSRDRSVRIWDAILYEEVAEFTGHTEQVNAICWDRSGRYVASGAGVNMSPCFDTTIKVWDVHARKNVTTLTGCKFNVTTIAFDRTGRYIASACSCESAVCIWDLKAPTNSHKPNANYFNLAWSSSSSLIAASKLTFNSEVKLTGNLDNLQRFVGHDSNTEDFKIQMFDASTGITIAKKSGHSHIVTSIDFDTTGKYFASGSWDSTVRLWDAISFQEVAVLQGHTDHVNVVAFNSNGMYLASGSSDRTICIWSMLTHKQHIVLTGHNDNVDFVAWNRGECMHILFSHSAMTICTWDAISFQQISSSACLPKMVGISALALEYAGDLIAICQKDCGGYVTKASQRTSAVQKKHAVLVWDTRTCSTVASLKGHVDTVVCLAWHSGGRHIASGSHDKTVRLWDVFQQQQLAVLCGHSMPVLSVAFDCCDTRLSSSAYDGTIRIWDVQAHQSPSPISYSEQPDSIYFVCGRKYLVASFSDNSLLLMDATSLHLLARLSNCTQAIKAVYFSPSFSTVAISSTDESVRLWSALSGQPLASLSSPAPAAVCCSAWSSCEDAIILGTCDGSIGCWDAATGSLLSVLKCPDEAAVNSIIVSPDATLVAVTVESLLFVYVFDVRSSALLSSPTFTGDKSSLKWSTSGCALQDHGADLWRPS